MKEKKEYSPSQKIKFTLFLSVFFLIVITILGEIGTRIFSKTAQEYSDKSLMDTELGWLPKAHYSSSYEMSTHGDDPITYNVQYETKEHGFRQWGDVNSSKPKFLFIGDSYVQAVEVSNDKTFFYHVGDSLNLEVFAFGQAGYGTLQQKMILEKYLPLIKPDLIVLQTCDNDFVDNFAPLEYNSKYKVGLRRPYYDMEGNIDYRKPVPKWKEVVDKSKFLGLLRKKIENTFKGKDEKSAQDLMFELEEAYPPYASSLQITDKLMSEIKSLAGDIPIVAFSASPFEPQLTAFKELSESSGIPFDDGIGKEIQRLSWHKKKVYSQDGYHWSEKGHRKVSKLLIAYLYKQGIASKPIEQ
ncbi:MAG: SGNH/GDSL hydrolase family protein [Bacteroidota bacterium]